LLTLLGSHVFEEPSEVPLGDGIADAEGLTDHEDRRNRKVGPAENHGFPIGLEAFGGGAQA
jgi:hypothetical protein